MNADFAVESYGSIFLLQPLTPEAQAWIDEFISEDAQYLGSAVAVEHRYIVDIVDGFKEEGLARFSPNGLRPADAILPFCKK
jgi:hypothetical protein